MLDFLLSVRKVEKQHISAITICLCGTFAGNFILLLHRMRQQATCITNSPRIWFKYVRNIRSDKWYTGNI